MTKNRRPLPNGFKKVTAVAILKRAHELMARRGGWTRQGWKVPHTREAINPEDYSYCIQGACNQAAYELGYAVPFAGMSVTDTLSLEELSWELHGTGCIEMNDSSSKSRVLKLIESKLLQFGERL